MSNDVFLQTIIFLGSAIVCVPIAKKLGMGSVLGYIFAGILIGPYVLGFVGHEGEDIMHAAEFGVVMMLFLIGLELKPSEFWHLRKFILGLGGIQVFATTGLFFFVGNVILGWHFQQSLAVSLALSLSSTAIILQTLKEKGLNNTSAGKASFSVLLFQDIMVVPILALLPMLSGSEPHASAHSSQSLFDDIPSWAQTLVVLGSVSSIFVVGKLLVGPLLSFISKTKQRELFTGTALFLVVGVAYVMTLVGLTPALGTFLAGVVLANSEYRHELESDLLPFKGLLLGLFFIGVGSSINFELLIEKPLIIASWVISFMVLKSIVLVFCGFVFKLKKDQWVLFVLLLSQVGEFAFVILNFSGQLNLIDEKLIEILMASTAVSMVVTPVLLLLNERFIVPNFGVKGMPAKENDKPVSSQHEVIIAGFGHFGSTVGRFLRASGVESTILDNDSDRVDLLRKMGFMVYYGDATRIDLLKAAGADEAKMLIAAIDSPEVNISLIQEVRKHFPHLKIMARARNRFDAYELMDMGVDNIYRETLYTSVHLAEDALIQLGHRAHTVNRKAKEFIMYDEQSLSKLSKYRHKMNLYVRNVREQIELQERMLSSDIAQNMENADDAWNSDIIKKGITKN